MIAPARMNRKPRGHVTIRAWRRGKLLWTREGDNLIVNAALGPIANLVGGAVVATNAIAVVGFGSGTTAPTVNDTDITAPAYYKAVASVSYPQSGYAQFTWEIVGSTDTGAVGINVQELAFYANSGSVALPIARAAGAGAPNLTMMAHILLNVGVIASNGSYTGTWTFEA